MKRITLLGLLAISLLASAGCQSIVGRDKIRPQSPGMGSMPRPRDPSSSTDPTLIEEWSGYFTKFWKPEPNSVRAQKLYQQADQSFLQKEYGYAADLYEEAADFVPDSLLEEDCMFMTAECYFFDDDYANASDAYLELLKKFGNTRHLDRVTRRMFAVAQYWREHDQQHHHYAITPNLTDGSRPWFDTRGRALKAYEAVWLNDPTGPLADDSVIQTAHTHFLDENWLIADQYYSQLRNDFPNSKHVVKAFLLGFRAKLESYQGPGYDPKPLLDAEELIETLLSQFSSQLDAVERQLVNDSRDEVRAQKAEREWYMAELYASSEYYRAAGHYYHKVIKKFPGTEFAKMAAKRLEEIAGKPPEPPKRLVWLARLFPDRYQIPKPIGHPSEEE